VIGSNNASIHAQIRNHLLCMLTCFEQTLVNTAMPSAAGTGKNLWKGSSKDEIAQQAAAMSVATHLVDGVVGVNRRLRRRIEHRQRVPVLPRLCVQICMTPVAAGFLPTLLSYI